MKKKKKRMDFMVCLANCSQEVWVQSLVLIVKYLQLILK